MNQNRKWLAGLLLLASASFSVADEVVLPEVATAVIVSNRDVNRVHCPRGVQDVIWSAEKPVRVTKSEDNVYVKFLVARQGEQEQRVTVPLDVHVVCGGATYTLILHPRDMDSVTVRLGNGARAKLSAVAKEWGAIPVEDRVKRLTLAVYRNELPEGFARTSIRAGDPRRNMALFENAQLVGQYEIAAPGTGLRAVEYVVYATEAVQLSERDFLIPELGNIVGITLERLNVEKDSFARLIIIERAGAEEDLS
jgi:conjugal transfer pilus assembly protein TraK